MAIDEVDGAVILAVGCRYHNESSGGFIDTYRMENGVWTHTSHLLASGSTALFGYSVSLFGKNLAVGAPGDANGGSNLDQGAIFTYTATPEGAWLSSGLKAGPGHWGTQQQQHSQRMGTSLSISGR